MANYVIILAAGRGNRLKNKIPKCFVCLKNIPIYSYSLKTLKEIPLKVEEITWSVDTAKKDGYNHFMLKEIHEQVTALDNTIRPRIINSTIDLSADGIDDIAIETFKNIDKIHVVACGTALHAGKVGASVFQDILKIPVMDFIASEYRYNNTLTDDKTLVIVLSQSGETIDTLASLEKAKSKGAKVISIVNVKGSTIARESDYVLYTHAGPEIAVASTKAYTVQVATIYLLLTEIAYMRGTIDEKFTKSICDNLYRSIDNIKLALEKENDIRDIVKFISGSHDAFYIGRGLDYVFSLEGALKLKEV
jgi:glucosamine--fructose-6-phosphate aminotransferase (isomerizing)